MIAATIGRTFLRAFNEKTGQNMTAKEFFEKEYIPLFFDHPKYLMTGGNAPLENPKIPKGTTPSSEERKIRIAKTIEKIESKSFDASVAIGFPASEDGNGGFQPFSGQTTNLKLPYTVNDKYLTWIGSGFGIGLKGALSIYFDDKDILWKIYEGWKVYREALNDKSLPQFRGNQIESWNAQWLNYNYDKRLYREDFDFASFHNAKVFNVDTTVVEVNMLLWVKLFFSLSKEFPEKDLIGYVYSLGSKGNTTVGFIPFHFQSATSLVKFYKKLFGEFEAINNAPMYEEIFGLKFYKACQLGAIGLQALQPADLFEDINKEKKISEIQYKTYKTWLTAMINKEETLELTGVISQKLHQFEQSSKGTDRRAIVEKILKATRKEFLHNWAEVVEQTPKENREGLKGISDKVFYMTNEDYGYFIALLRLDYRYQD